MNGDTPAAVGWSRQRWAACVLALFALHLAVFHFLVPRPAGTNHASGPRPTVRWLTEPTHARRTLDALLLDDPTLLAAASPRGFSGAAWLRPAPAVFLATEWTDAERSLEQPITALGGAFHPAANANAAPFEPARKSAPPADQPATRPALRTNSQVRVEGALRARPPAGVPPLRSWPVADVLADTRVLVLVTSEGLVFSPRLASAATARTPAQRAADEHALEVTRSLRFAPAPKSAPRDGSLTEGTMVFQWHTVEPPPAAKE